MNYLNIAGLTLALDGFDYDFFRRRTAEYVTDPAPADITVTYSETDKIIPPDGKYISTNMIYRKYFRSDDFYQIYDILQEPDIYSAALDISADTKTGKAQLVDIEKLGGPALSLRSFNMLGELFRYFILKNNGMVLHSSCISYKGNGLMFSAPSGTGKSTHSGLWKKYYSDDVTVINDDSPALRFMPDGIKVCGTPWSGKTDINSNISAPLKAIVMLQQKPENTIRRLSVDEAVFKLMNEVTRPAYNDLFEITLNNIEKIISSVPVYLLGCNISKEAVDLVKDTYCKEKINMKIKDTFVLRTIAGSSIVVPTGAEMMDFNGMITLNETGAFLWEKMQSETDIASLADAMIAEYTGISREDAEADIKEFIATLDAKGIIENG